MPCHGDGHNVSIETDGATPEPSIVFRGRGRAGSGSLEAPNLPARQDDALLQCAGLMPGPGPAGSRRKSRRLKGINVELSMRTVARCETSQRMLRKLKLREACSPIEHTSLY